MHAETKGIPEIPRVQSQKVEQQTKIKITCFKFNAEHKLCGTVQSRFTLKK